MENQAANQTDQFRAQWYWKSNFDPWSADENEEWTKYSYIESEIIEKAFNERNKTRKIELDNCWIDINDSIEISKSDENKQRPIKRVLIKAPSEVLPQPFYKIFNDVSTNEGGSLFIRHWIINNNHLSNCEIVEKAADGIIVEGNLVGRHLEAQRLAGILADVKNKSREEIYECCVKLYTLDSFLYKLVNRTLRYNDESKADTLAPFCYFLFNACHNSGAKYSMDVYRGSQLDQSEIKAYSEAIGEYKCWLGFTSTTKNREVAQMFGDTLFIIDASSCGGSDISLLSQFTDEEEVLLPAGATFKIHKVVFDQETQKYCIFLELLPEVRLVVLGKTGTGKSSFGNTVLAREQFEADCAFESITTRCSVGLRVFNDKNWVIVDTPGFFDTKLPKQQVQREVAGSYQITAPGPHVFLVVVELGRFTEEEERAVEWITKIFGDRAVDYCIIIFTHLDKIIKAKKKKTVDKYLQNANPALIKLLDKCDNRYIAVDNTASDDAKEQTLKDLSDKISKMIAKNGERFYTTSEFQQVAMQLKKVAKETRCKFNPLKSDGTVNVLPEVEKIVACELDIS